MPIEAQIQVIVAIITIMGLGVIISAVKGILQSNKQATPAVEFWMSAAQLACAFIALGLLAVGFM